MGSELILIVEDNDVLRQGLRDVLEGKGYAVTTAVHGMEALDCMAKMTPDLILSDVMMPEMDGFEFFDTVRKRSEWNAIPFIFLSARNNREDMLDGIRRGAEDYLPKPITPTELVTRVRSRLERSRAIYDAQLGRAYQASLIMLANAIEYRSPNTRGHVERVRDYTLAIGRNLENCPISMPELEYGSLLHDVGKIHIPQSILHKAGPLNDSEWSLIKQHPVIGAKLLGNVPYLAPAIRVIRHHHERWDGAGYPDGLTGERIPLSARIVAVADALDAMTNPEKLPYRKPFPADKAFEEIIRCSSSQFDPEVVKAFQSGWHSIKSMI
jgi:putative two-component system response regulator